jgi:hypothetical protein
MNATEQLELDVPVDEAQFFLWLSNGVSQEPENWWNELPKYVQSWWRREYREARERLETWWREFHLGVATLADRYYMPRPETIWNAREEHMRQAKEIASKWAIEIKEAFLTQKPCPIAPMPRFRYILDMAFELAQVPVGCLAVVEPKEGAANV